MLPILFLVVVAIVLAIFAIGIYNSMVELKYQVTNAYAQIEVQLKRRHDLIPNLIETVKGYMAHEAQTLENVTKARQIASHVSQDPNVQASNENVLSGALKSLFAVSENYPELLANQNFMVLQEELAATENKIGFARQFYNDAVMNYNTKKEVFPNNMIVGMFNFPEYAMFEITDSSEREAVKVDFN